MLVDCGEGTQRQLLRSTIGLIELPEVFLTHYHADHYLGLPGMLKTFALRSREVPLTVYGPRACVTSSAPSSGSSGSSATWSSSSSSETATSSTAATTASSPSRWRTASRPTATRSWSFHGRAASTSRPRGRWECRPGRSSAASRPASPSSCRTAARFAPSRSRAAQAWAADRLRRRHGACGERSRGREGRRRPRPRGHLRRGGARARRRDRALHRRRRGGARSGRGGADARPDAPLQPVLRPGDRSGGARGFPGDSGSEGLRYHRRPVPGAGRPPAHQRRSETDARGGRAA